MTSLAFAEVAHERTAPLHHAFTYRVPMWVVDVDDLPRVARPLRSLFRFDAADHFGDPDATIRENVDAFLVEHAVPPPARVTMLANPRSLGHCFNPLSVYWCLGADDALLAVIAEVHNTYGGRHCYLVHPDADGRASAAKELYVSPFFPVDGGYELRFSPVGAPLDVAIALRRDGTTVFRAALTSGPLVPVRSVLASALRHPASSWWVSARIRWQGVRLWLKRLPVVPRPTAAEVAQKVQVS